mmetsp:Transcript_16567/g.42465  ORF Transcript_16567/g.42465 Transcript_16567/m.42465 type:complete len:286 (+) Transcript_16567:174-1031(+)
MFPRRRQSARPLAAAHLRTPWSAQARRPPHQSSSFAAVPFLVLLLAFLPFFGLLSFLGGVAGLSTFMPSDSLSSSYVIVSSGRRNTLLCHSNSYTSGRVSAKSFTSRRFEPFATFTNRVSASMVYHWSPPPPVRCRLTRRPVSSSASSLLLILRGSRRIKAMAMLPPALANTASLGPLPPFFCCCWNCFTISMGSIAGSSRLGFLFAVRASHSSHSLSSSSSHSSCLPPGSRSPTLSFAAAGSDRLSRRSDATKAMAVGDFIGEPSVAVGLRHGPVVGCQVAQGC